MMQQPLRFRSRITSKRLRTSRSVRLLVGSSKASTLASSISALAISSICRWAMERLRTLAAGSMCSPSRSSAAAAARRTALRSTKPSLAGRWPSMRFSSTLMSGTRFSSW